MNFLQFAISAPTKLVLLSLEMTRGLLRRLMNRQSAAINAAVINSLTASK